MEDTPAPALPHAPTPTHSLIGVLERLEIKLDLVIHLLQSKH